MHKLNTHSPITLFDKCTLRKIDKRAALLHPTFKGHLNTRKYRNSKTPRLSVANRPPEVLGKSDSVQNSPSRSDAFGIKYLKLKFRSAKTFVNNCGFRFLKR